MQTNFKSNPNKMPTRPIHDFKTTSSLYTNLEDEPIRTLRAKNLGIFFVREGVTNHRLFRGHVLTGLKGGGTSAPIRGEFFF